MVAQLLVASGCTNMQGVGVRHFDKSKSTVLMARTRQRMASRDPPENPHATALAGLNLQHSGALEEPLCGTLGVDELVDDLSVPWELLEDLPDMHALRLTLTASRLGMTDTALTAGLPAGRPILDDVTTSGPLILLEDVRNAASRLLDMLGQPTLTHRTFLQNQVAALCVGSLRARPPAPMDRTCALTLSPRAVVSRPASRRNARLQHGAEDCGCAQ